jgi:hypothetical protein
MQAGGMGLLINPVTNQPINGLTMAGYPQAGYPPIGYAPMGYAPGYPRYAAGMIDTGESEETDDEEVEEAILSEETRSKMPVPRFHPIPSKPVFQRSEGMPSTPSSQRNISKPKTTAMIDQRGVSDGELEAALDQAYLEGVSAAMKEVERKMDDKRKMVAKAKLQEKILRQAEYVQQQLDEQERQQLLAVQQMRQERQSRQQAAQQSEMLLAVSEPVLEPKRLPSQKQAAVPKNLPQSLPVTAKTVSTASVKPTQKGGMVNSVSSGVSGVFSSIWGSNQKEHVLVKPQTQSPTKSRSGSGIELAAVQPDLPIRPPVSPVPFDYGLLPEEETGPLIIQAKFSADREPVAP